MNVLVLNTDWIFTPVIQLFKFWSNKGKTDKFPHVFPSTKKEDLLREKIPAWASEVSAVQVKKIWGFVLVNKLLSV